MNISFRRILLPAVLCLALLTGCGGKTSLQNDPWEIHVETPLPEENTQLRLSSGTAYTIEKVTPEIPSNETDYDREVSLGMISKQWEFLEKTWHVRIGSEDVKPTGLRQTFEETGEGHVSFAAEEGFWLETFDGGVWRLLKEPLTLSPGESRTISVSWEQKETLDIDWSDSYGPLPEGFYGGWQNRDTALLLQIPDSEPANGCPSERM